MMSTIPKRSTIYFHL